MIYPIITIRQPWAALIVNGIKDVENRNWRLPDKYCNCTVLVHASAKPEFDPNEAENEMVARGWPIKIAPMTMLSGAIIGAVWFKGCKFDPLGDGAAPLPSPWAERDSKFWWMIEAAKPLAPYQIKGQLRFWKFDYPRAIEWM